MPDLPTDLSICSSIMTRLGGQPVQSFTEGTPESDLCAREYPRIRRECLASYDWDFATLKTQLSRDSVTPLTRWTYQYTLPSDRIHNAPKAVFNSDDPYAPYVKNFEVVGNKLMCHEEQVWIDYVADVQEQFWPPYFVTLVVYEGCAQLAFALTDESSLSDKYDVMAHGSVSDNRVGGQTAQARLMDSRQSAPQVFEDFTLVYARFNGV